MAIKTANSLSEGIGRVYRINEFAQLVGYRESTIRKKIYERVIAYKRVGRIIVIPETEAKRLLQNDFPVLETTEQ